MVDQRRAIRGIMKVKEPDPEKVIQEEKKEPEEVKDEKKTDKVEDKNLEEQGNVYFIAHLATKNDANGNPRRIFVVFDADGNVIDAVDEGYRGTAVVDEKYPGVPKSGRIDIQPKEYTFWKRRFKNKPTEETLDEKEY